jgi:hypothetical protein
MVLARHDRFNDITHLTSRLSHGGWTSVTEQAAADLLERAVDCSFRLSYPTKEGFWLNGYGLSFELLTTLAREKCCI